MTVATMSSSTVIFMFVIFLMATIVSSSSPNNAKESSIEKRYMKWLSRYKNLLPSNVSNMDLKNRFETYKHNVQFIDKFNSENHSFTLTDNQFADMTNKEFRATFLNGMSRNHTHGEKGRNMNYPNNSEVTPLHVSWDWRKMGAVGPIKNQAACGSCWAFSTVAAVESLTYLKTRKLLNLSEQQVVSCDTTNYGCEGGFEYKAFEYIAKYGLATSDDYPYMAVNGTCKSNFKKAATINGYRCVEPYSEAHLLYAVAKQPVSVSITAGSPKFQFYKEGIFSCSKCGYHTTNHAVLVVGFGHDLLTGYDYWIIKNSWAETWGDSGYMKVRRNACDSGMSVCGITMDPCYPI